jgi:hypothetical protein
VRLSVSSIPSEIRPIHAGRYLAERTATRERPLGDSVAALGALGARLHDDTARRRFAEQAGRGLAGPGLGPGGSLERALAARMVQAAQDPDRSFSPVGSSIEVAL